MHNPSFYLISKGEMIYMTVNEKKRAVIFSSIKEKEKIETELERLSKLTGFSISKIIECMSRHCLFPKSMNSDIWEVISKHLARNKTTK